MSRAIDKSRERAMGDQRQELHARTLELVLGEMTRCSSVHDVRELLLAIAADLEEFDRGPSPGSAS